MGPRSPVCRGPREQPAPLGAVGRQPWLTFEGCELFRQVLFIAVLLVTEELLQRWDHSTETGLGAKVTYKQPQAEFTPASHQPSGQIHTAWWFSAGSVSCSLGTGLTRGSIQGTEHFRNVPCAGHLAPRIWEAVSSRDSDQFCHSLLRCVVLSK